ncbi:kinase-like domain-containing protein [Suillus subalutaceus]|uniref:kinase-like domain-containing protein n=1 Tax=Suillus subalutaceus TaxID=48586 RepID=UPI001B86453D|nr:kinase-like domain-containing protein [Suillus subalutaceus]KAG1843272.1 kinase-like domain-containing protein [Suillus subalutaceus]
MWPAQPKINAHESNFPPEAMLQDLSKYITKNGDYPVARGGFGEVWKCTYLINRRSTKVAVKTLQVYADETTNTKKIKRIKRELRLCASLSHANILPVCGYAYGFGPLMAIVSPWADNGNLTTYLKLEGAALTLVRRFRILKDIIAGLQYPHANSIIHGDLIGPNVLIHGDGTACIADFGLSLMYSEVISVSQSSWTSTLKGNVRWMAPELLVEREDGFPTRPSEQSDIYSFGRNHILTNKTPYYYLLNDAAVILSIARSQMPSRSRYPALPDKYWSLIQQCWSTEPRDRPSTENVDGTIRNEFHSLSRPLQNPSLAVLHDLTRYITKDQEYPAAGGGFGEIWKCTHKKDGISVKVAVKSLRVYAADQGKEKKNERIRRELGICASLKHANILPVYGYTYGFSPFIAIVSHWAENGDLTAYLGRKGETLTVVQRFQILRDVIAGLQYLHVNHVIHGDFNGLNILIHGDGTACIADFGLSLMYSEVIGASKASWTSTPIQGNLPWMAPELLQEQKDGCQVRPSEQSDIYSFGGIMLQVLTNKIPYYYLTHQPAIIICIANSEKPDRTLYPVILDKYWQFIDRCWSTLPQDRPSAEEVEGDIRNEFYLLSGSP